MELHNLTAHEIHEVLLRKEVSCEEVVQATLDRIEAVEPDVQAFMLVTPEVALEQAKAVDEKLAAGERIGPLEGAPLAIKDLICTKGLPTTCSSRILENFLPPYDATVVEKTKAAGCAMVGKTNMDEFAMGSSGENSAFEITRNPWDLECVPGGSSAGSAVAVAAGECAIALGSDTGGSIRLPASFCGAVGLKPTYGRVSRYGLIAFASSLDQIGPLTKDVRDCALLMNVISGHDPMDSTSVEVEVPDFTARLNGDVKGLKAGVIKEFRGDWVEPEVQGAVDKAIEDLEELGVACEEVSLPHSMYSLATYYLIAPAEASSNLARYDGVRYGHRSSQPAEDIIDMFSKTRAEGFGPEVRLRIMLGTYALSAGYYDAYYLKALKVRTLIKRECETAFEKYDVLVSPTSPTVAFKIGERADDPLQMKMADLCTMYVNLAGIPAISVPCGFSDGLPIGLQIAGRAFDEETVLRVAYAYEQKAAHPTDTVGRASLLGRNGVVLG
ncbi:MAG: Asp-tRNA(Asn)/Glu-tRNA(Gln) amidotransferase subunit GatA [Armatimonadota bacterium]